MPIDITCKTDRFNLSVIGEDFINDCCFGEDFSVWLVEELNNKGLKADVICMEDFGWANQVTLNEQVYLLCIAGNSDELPDNPNYGEWHVMLEKKRKLKEIILGRNKDNKEEAIYSILKELLISNGFECVKI